MCILKLCNNIHYMPVYHSYYYITSCQKSTICIYVYIRIYMTSLLWFHSSTPNQLKLQRNHQNQRSVCRTHLRRADQSPRIWSVADCAMKRWVGNQKRLGKWWEKRVAGWSQPIWKHIFIRVNHTYRELVCVWICLGFKCFASNMEL